MRLIHEGEQNEVATSSASCSRPRGMRGERKFRPRKTDQACGTDRAHLVPDIPRKSFVARAEAANSKADASEGENNSLMECASDACKLQCSPRVEKHSRPKWCMYFKEPSDRHSLSATSDEQRKSTE